MDSLNEEIEERKIELADMVSQFGIADEKVIEVSQKLDALIAESMNAKKEWVGSFW